MKALAAIPAARQHAETAAQIARQRGAAFGFAAIVDEQLPAETAQRIGIGAGHLDSASQGPRAERAGTAAACHADAGKPFGRDRAEGDEAEERIAHRHAIQQHQRAAAGIAAQRPQRRPLRAGVGRTAVRTAELLEARHRAQRIFDPA